MSASAALDAAEFTGRLWAALTDAGTLEPGDAPDCLHYQRVYDPGWLGGLPLPLQSPGQPVALASAHDFERHDDEHASRLAYAARPRTRIYEDAGRTDPAAWYGITARHLGRLARCREQVVCSVFESVTGDEHLGVHHDTWAVAAIQVTGTKHWQTGHSLMTGDGSPHQDILTQPGDILLIPKGLPHIADTPPGPGYSIHLVFAIDRDQPLLD
jgi:hypothetical protein